MESVTALDFEMASAYPLEWHSEMDLARVIRSAQVTLLGGYIHGYNNYVHMNHRG